MQLTRLVVGWLADPTDGVNALLPGVPLDGGDTQPASVVVIDDESLDDVVAMKRIDQAATSGLAVMLAGVRWQEDEVIASTARHGEADIGIRYWTTQQDPFAAVRDMHYVLRAVERSLRRFAVRGTEVERTRNGVTLQQLLRLERFRADAQLDDTLTTGGVTATFRIWDSAAEG